MRNQTLKEGQAHSTSTAVGLLIHNLLGLLLGLLQPGGEIGQRLGRQHQARRDQSLAGRHNAIAATLFIFGAVDLEQMLLDVTGHTDRVPSGVVDGAANLLGVLTDDGEARVDLGQTLVAQSVGAGQVGSHIAVGSGEVWQDWFGEAVVSLVTVLDGLGANGVAFDEGDGVGDDGVGSEMLEKRAG